LTYANATAALLASLSVLAVAYRLQRPTSAVRTAAACVMLIGLAATMSRAGMLVVLVGLVLLAGLAGVRATVVYAAAPVVGALAAFAAMVPSLPITEPARPALAAAGLVVGLSIAIGLAHLANRRPTLTAVLAGSVTAALVGTAIATVGPALRTIATTRLNLDSFGRSGAARAALGMVADHPLFGVGPGRARFMWTDAVGRAVVARYAHNEYLQLMVEMGVIGLALLLVLLVSLADTTRRGRPIADASAVSIWAGGAAALGVLVVHSAFDFLWHIPVLPLTAAAMAGLSSRGSSSGSHA
jgi:O-antigen ligase